MGPCKAGLSPLQSRSTAADSAVQQIEAQISQTLDRLHSAIEASQDTQPQRKNPEVSVIIPVFNEQATIVEIIERVLALPLELEVIVVDDGSSDGTRAVLEQYDRHARVFCHLHAHNQGKGAALRTGIAEAKGDFVVIQDADLEYDPINIISVIRPLQAGLSEVAYGSRYLLEAQQDQSFIHRLGNWLLTSFSNLLSRQSLTDMETCYKAFQRELIQSIQIEENRFGFEPEITAKLAKLKTQISEVPVSYQPRSWQQGKKIGWKDLVRTLYCIIKYNWR